MGMGKTVWGVVAAVACAAGAWAQPVDIGERLEVIRARHGLPALAALVTTSDETVAIGAVGVRQMGDETPVTTSDLWHLGSCTKSMTGTLAAVMVERGLIGWDTTVGEILGEVMPDMQEAYRGVTLEQLMCHRAGLSTAPPPRAFARARTQEGSVREQRAEFVRAALREAPAHEAGTAFEYSNQGTIVAAAMLERAWERADPGGEPASWEDLVARLVFEPLGITEYGFGAPGTAGEVEEPRGHVQGAIPGAPVVPMVPGPHSDNPPAYGPAGRVHMSLEDWAVYVREHLRGRQGRSELLPREAWEHLHADPYGEAEGQAFEGYGMGWVLHDRAWGGRVIAHAGSNTMWYCVVWASPEEGFAVLVATNLAGEGDAGAKATDEAAGELIEAFVAGEFGE